MTVSVPSFELPPWAVVTALVALAVPLYLCVAIWAARFAKWLLTRVDLHPYEADGMGSLIGMFWPFAVPLMLVMVIIFQTVLWAFSFIHNRS